MKNIKIVFGILVLVVMLLCFCSCEDYDKHSFDAVTDANFTMTKDEIVALDNRIYASKATYRSYIDDHTTRLVFESGAREYVLDNETGELIKITMTTDNTEFFDDVCEACGDYDSKDGKGYHWSGTLYGEKALMTIYAYGDSWTVVIEAA